MEWSNYKHIGVRVTLSPDEVVSVYERIKAKWGPHCFYANHQPDKDCKHPHAHVVIPVLTLPASKESFNKVLKKLVPELAGGRACSKFSTSFYDSSPIDGCTYIKHQRSAVCYGSPEAQELFRVAPEWVEPIPMDQQDVPLTPEQIREWTLRRPTRAEINPQLSSTNILGVLRRYRYHYFPAGSKPTINEVLYEMYQVPNGWRLGKSILRGGGIEPEWVEEFEKDDTPEWQGAIDLIDRSLPAKYKRRFNPYDKQV